MSYIVLARRFRPQNLEEVVGQEHVGATLRNAISGARLAHAYLFSGPRGVGKTSMARILAKALNCHKAKGPTADPCGKCPSCEEIADGRSLDVVEMDAASHTGVDDVRDLREGALYSTARDRFKVYIIDEAHMMSRSAFNALLKTLEEPPPHVKFVFATTEPERLPDTIQSRCQRFDFRRISTADIRKRLEQIAAGEKLAIEPDALSAVARHSRGGLRDAEGLLDQLISYRGKEKIRLEDVLGMIGAVSDEETGKLFAALRAGSAGEALTVLSGCLDAGAELDEVAASLADRIRGALLVAVAGPDSALVSGDYGHLVAELQAEAGESGSPALVRMGAILSEARRAMRSSPEPRLILELALVRLASLPDVADVRELLDRLDAQPAASGPAPAARPLPSPAPHPVRTAPARAPAPSTQQTPTARPRETAVPAAAPRDETAPGKWDAIRAALAGAHPATNRLLDKHQSAAVSGDSLTITLSPGASFTLEQLDKPDKRAQIEAAAAGVLGRPVRVELRMSAHGGAPAPGQARPAARRPEPPAKAEPAPRPKASPEAMDKAAEHPAVRKLISKFDGQIIDIKKSGKP
ncbi:MAG TPA: DNA polymerase III subunit gamma/tau [Planctomycetota bacterium]|nr:DNA polymerase III subunit gamma/tau [Planctomycetota bacterium]